MTNRDRAVGAPPPPTHMPGICCRAHALAEASEQTAPPLDVEQAVKTIHDEFCEFVGGGMCYRLECWRLDFIRKALGSTPSKPGEAE